MLLKRLALGQIDTLCRDQRHRDRLPSSLMHGCVADCWTVAIRFVRRAVILKTDAIILQECRALHKPASLATAQLRSGCTARHSTVILAASCSAFALGREGSLDHLLRIRVLAVKRIHLEIAPKAKFANLNRRSWYPVV